MSTEAQKPTAYAILRRLALIAARYEGKAPTEHTFSTEEVIAVLDILPAALTLLAPTLPTGQHESMDQLAQHIQAVLFQNFPVVYDSTHRFTADTYSTI